MVVKTRFKIEKKHAYYLITFIAVFIGITYAIAQASAPNPGHAADEIGEGTIANTLTVSGGNVGIGVTDPLSKLVLPDTSSLAWKNAGSSGGEFTGISSISSVLTLGTNGLTRMVIDTSGNVGIGTTSPTVKLHIAGNLRLDDGNNDNMISGGIGGVGSINFRDNVLSGMTFGTTERYQWQINSATKMVMDNSGNVGIGTVSPAARLEITSGGNPSPNIQINSAEGRGIKIDKTGGGETLLYLTQNDVYNNAFLEAFGGGETPLLARIDGVGGAYFAGNVIVNSLSGSGNAYACINANGQLYRSATACS